MSSHCCKLNCWTQLFILHVDSDFAYLALKVGCIFLPFDFGLSRVSHFRQWDSSKCDASRDLKCTCVVQLVLLCQLVPFPSTWEENSPAGPHSPKRMIHTWADQILQASMWSKAFNTAQPQSCENKYLWWTDSKMSSNDRSLLSATWTQHQQVWNHSLRM